MAAADREVIHAPLARPSPHHPDEQQVEPADQHTQDRVLQSTTAWSISNPAYSGNCLRFFKKQLVEADVRGQRSHERDQTQPQRQVGREPVPGDQPVRPEADRHRRGLAHRERERDRAGEVLLVRATLRAHLGHVAVGRSRRAERERRELLAPDLDQVPHTGAGRPEDGAHDHAEHERASLLDSGCAAQPCQRPADCGC